MAKVCQLFSGSSGNSIFISDGNTKFLVDTGVSAKRIEEALSAIGENASELSGIFVTHEHTDHVSGLRVLASRHKIPVFADERVISKLYSENLINEKVNTELIESNMELGGIEILPFELSHDSAACLGYRFNLGGEKSVAVCTDTGIITPDAKSILAGTGTVFLESNHEVRMLQNGPYTYFLKQRILSERGHLSNADSAEFAAYLAKNGTSRFFLAHISRDNNLPEIAKQTALNSLGSAGFTENKDFRLKISPPVNSERAIII